MKTALVILSLCLALSLSAQVLPSRNIDFTYLSDTSAARGFLSRVRFYGEMQRGFRSDGDDRAWDATSGGEVEFYRWSNSAAVAFGANNEMLANALNDIGFNPRSTYWEESLSGIFHAQGFAWEAGITNRCKHEIDNTDPPNSDNTPLIDSNAQKRVLVLGSMYGIIAPDAFMLAPYVTLRYAARADFYWKSEEYRFPANNDGLLWSNVWSSAMLEAQIEYAAYSTAALYARGWIAGVFARGGSQHTGADWRAEAGVRFTGALANLYAFAAYQHLFDDLSTTEPRASNTLSIGLRIE